MQITGNLQLPQGYTTGHVVVKNASTQDTISTVSTNDKGWFDVENLPANTDLHFLGYSGIEHSGKDAATVLADPSLALYQAVFKAGSNHRLGVFINAASSFIAEHLKTAPALGFEAASKTVKSYLYGDAYSVFSPGYSTEFLATVVPASVFDPEVFLDAAAKHGSTSSLIQGMLTDVAEQTEGTPFGSKAPAEAAAESSVTSSNNPIPHSANWAVYDTNWNPIIQQQSGGLEARLQNLADLSDGANAAVNGIPSGDDATDALQAGGITLGSLAKFVGENVAGSAIGYVADFGFSMLKKWIFGSNDPDTKIQNALTKIVNQLNTVIANQQVQIQLLHEILRSVKKNNVQTIVSSMQQPVSIIQTTYQTIFTHSQTTTGYSSSDLTTLAQEILDPTTGIGPQLTSIDNGINGEVLSSLPDTLNSYLTEGQVLLGNENFYAATQQIFAYYALTQTQGVITIIQAHNYNANESVSDATSTLTINPAAATEYNTWLIGGSGYTSGGQSQKPRLEQQVSLFQNANKSYYSSFQNYVSSTMPADLCIGLVPQITNQSTPIYYNKDANVLVFGYVSSWFENWTSGTNVFEINNIETSSMPLPAGMKWRYPSSTEWNAIIADGKAEHPNHVFKYLEAQGISFAGLDIETLPGLWSSSSMEWSPGWDIPTHSVSQPDSPAPKDSNYDLVACGTWCRTQGPFGPGPYHVTASGNFPMALSNDTNKAMTSNTTFYEGYIPNSSMVLSSYGPGTPELEWWGEVFFQKICGMIVADGTASNS